ncbi:hypothetical protein L6164_028220 [Bauhinia variegata]|uniref:Uncharacterized protein n=1 Tax=Bauhinia variegata TaxID=167791 RepID=A0ACB9LVE3_BAUVA|nr:hypothetical protein L6164_028220 [Bauhinia variegata]
MQPDTSESNRDFLVGLSPGGCRQKTDSIKSSMIDSGSSHMPELQFKNWHLPFPAEVHCSINIDLMLSCASGLAAPAKLIRFLRFDLIIFNCHAIISSSE